MAPELHNRSLDRLLGPRLGYVMATWPQPAHEGLAQMARKAGVEVTDLVNTLRETPEDPRWDRLIHLSTISHTFFNRHPEHFVHLRELLMEAAPGQPIWIWCAGCATGEEAYSLALHCQDLPVDVRIVATDVDPEAIAYAQRGTYPPERARQLPFVSTGDSWQAPEALRARVRFEHGSLTEGAPDPEQFDYIFCRNVMVYFGARKAVHLGRLLSHLKPDGHIVLAPTEALGELPTELLRDVPIGWLHPKPIAGPSSIRPAADASAPPRRMRRETHPLATPAVDDPLERTALWSAEGELGEAERALRDALENDPSDAVRWFLLGEVLAQRGDVDPAREAFSEAARYPVTGDAQIDEPTLHLAARERSAYLDVGED